MAPGYHDVLRLTCSFCGNDLEVLGARLMSEPLGGGVFCTGKSLDSLLGCFP